jgi:hypothetical protein
MRLRRWPVLLIYFVLYFVSLCAVQYPGRTNLTQELRMYTVVDLKFWFAFLCFYDVRAHDWLTSISCHFFKHDYWKLDRREKENKRNEQRSDLIYTQCPWTPCLFLWISSASLSYCFLTAWSGHQPGVIVHYSLVREQMELYTFSHCHDDNSL